MTVAELRSLLEDVDPNLVVILQKDAEGNGYSPLAETSLALYEETSTYSGEVYGYDDKDDADEPSSLVEALILVPVN